MSATKTKRTNRTRKRAKKSTGVIRETRRDCGFCEPLDRYFELPANILGEMYNIYNGLPPESVYYRERLTELFQESEDFTSSRRLLDRPAYQHSYGLNSPAIYRKTLGTTLHLRRFNVRSETTIQWSVNTALMHIDEKRHDARPTDHDKELSVIAASIEIEASKDEGFITHVDILEHASEAAQTAESPLAMPVPSFTHTFPNGKKETVKATEMIPDFIFGIPFEENAAKFYTLEYDRHTETMEPSQTLSGKSWLKNILMMGHLRDARVYHDRYGISNLQMLAVFQGAVRERNFHALVRKYARYPNQFLTTVVAPFNAIAQPYVIRDLYSRPWNRADGKKFSIKTGKEVVDDGPGRSARPDQGVDETTGKDRRAAR